MTAFFVHFTAKQLSTMSVVCFRVKHLMVTAYYDETPVVLTLLTIRNYKSTWRGAKHGKTVMAQVITGFDFASDWFKQKVAGLSERQQLYYRKAKQLWITYWTMNGKTVL